MVTVLDEDDELPEDETSRPQADVSEPNEDDREGEGDAADTAGLPRR